MVRCYGSGVGPLAAALIGPLAWELLYAMGYGPKETKRKERKSILKKHILAWHISVLTMLENSKTNF